MCSRGRVGDQSEPQYIYNIYNYTKYHPPKCGGGFVQSSPALDFGTPVQFRAICLRSQGIGCLSMLSKPKPMFPLQWSEVQSEQGGVRSEHFEFWACQLTPDLCVQMVLYSNGPWTLVIGCGLEYNSAGMCKLTTPLLLFAGGMPSDPGRRSLDADWSITSSGESPLVQVPPPEMRTAGSSSQSPSESLSF